MLGGVFGDLNIVCRLVLGASVIAQASLRSRWLTHGPVYLIIVSIAVKSLPRGWSSLSVHCGFFMSVTAHSFMRSDQSRRFYGGLMLADIPHLQCMSWVLKQFWLI